MDPGMHSGFGRTLPLIPLLNLGSIGTGWVNMSEGSNNLKRQLTS